MSTSFPKIENRVIQTVPLVRIHENLMIGFLTTVDAEGFAENAVGEKNLSTMG